MYLTTAPLVDMMNGTSFIAMRAMASKLVPSDELGKRLRENCVSLRDNDVLDVFDWNPPPPTCPSHVLLGGAGVV